MKITDFRITHTRCSWLTTLGLCLLFSTPLFAQDNSDDSNLSSFELAKRVESPPPVTTNPRVFCNQQTFFEAVESETPTAFYQLTHPALSKLIDEPVFLAWTTAIKNRLGAVKDIEIEKKTTGENPDGRPTAITEAKVTFEKGTGTAKLETVDGTLISYNVQSDQLQNWFRGPANNRLYIERGRSFIRFFLLNEVNEAFNQCHPALQKEIPHAKLSEMIAQTRNAAGNLKSIKLAEDKFQSNAANPKLLLEYDIVGSKLSFRCLVTIQFIGMKGHLVAFQFK